MSAIDTLSDRDLLDAGMWALHDVDTVALRDVMRVVIRGTGTLAVDAVETTLAGAVAAVATDTARALGRDERARVLAAFEGLGVDAGDIIVAAVEIAEASS